MCKVCLHNSVGAVSPALASLFQLVSGSALNFHWDSWYSYGKEHLKNYNSIYKHPYIQLQNYVGVSTCKTTKLIVIINYIIIANIFSLTCKALHKAALITALV